LGGRELVRGLESVGDSLADVLARLREFAEKNTDHINDPYEVKPGCYPTQAWA